MTAETYVTDAATRHAVFVERFAGGEANKAKEHLERIRLGVIERLSRDPTDFRADRLGRVLNDIDTLISLVMQEMGEEINETVRDFASNEASFAGELIQSTSRTEVALPSDALLIAVINREGMSAPLGPEQITIQEALDQFAGKKSQEVLQTIKDAMVAGDTLSETTDRVSNLVNGRQKTQVEALTRTIMNHTSNHATKAVMQENQAILQGEKWVATLDSSTTLICGGRDGRIYPVGQGPYPPAHWQACVHDTMITTKRGEVAIQDVKVGDYVMTHMGRWRRVYAVMAKPHNGKYKRLKDNLGSIVRLTDDHPVLTKGDGWIDTGSINAGAVAFKYTDKLSRLKAWVLGLLVEHSILLDSHNRKTVTTERLVSYKVGSFTAGVSSSINLKDNGLVDNEISNARTDNLLKGKAYAVVIKEVIDKLFVKCRVYLKCFR